jgi:uncharacterized protein
MMTYDEFHQFLKRGNTSELCEALDGGLDPNLANKYGWTLLMLAAMTGNVDVGRSLITHGANVDSRNNGKDTALSLAIQQGHPLFVSLLLQNGASKDCYPHCNSLEIFIDWSEEYCSCSSASATKIRSLLGIAKARPEVTPVHEHK